MPPPPLVSLAVVVLQAAVLLLADAADQTGGLPNCVTTCGDVAVPYPFGVGTGCYHSPGFNLTCDTTRDPPRLLLGADGTFQLLNISLANATVRAARTGSVNFSFVGTSSSSVNGRGEWRGLGNAGPYALSDDGNELVIVRGCDVLAQLTAGGGKSNVTISGCASFCPGTDTGRTTLSVSDGRCTGVGCCEMPISIGLASYDVQLRRLDPSQSLPPDTNWPPLVLIAERGWLQQAAASTRGAPLPVNLDETPVPVLLGWAIGSAALGQDGTPPNGSTCPGDAARSACKSAQSSCRNVSTATRSGYVCDCQNGYHGNPYLTDGCQDINECEQPEENGCFGECINMAGTFECRCPPGTHGDHTQRHGCVRSSSPSLSIGIGVSSGAGLMLLVLVAILITRKHKQLKTKRLKQKFFKQNRGQLLQQLVAQRADIAERMIIPLEELEKATNNFDKARELGGGGHGTVYKGILSDLHVVAIKKSKIAVQREIDEFINEVAILSQINHRNIVKLFGCCLETEVPLLVYEFVSNGTLYSHLHVTEPRSLSWNDRLRIATETAKAIAYLHSAASVPIIHRDIKSTNILVDDALTSKVSDFGASRHIPVDRTGVTTKVQGTIGYMDPTYYYTRRLTEKSDVYSFGVVLVELLTRKKPYSYVSSEDEGLVAHFIGLLALGRMVEILDWQVTEEGGKQVEQVAALAATCVKLNPDERPTMRQVEMALESIQEKERVLDNDVAAEIDIRRRSPSDPQGRRRRSVQDMTRQYSLEEEFLLSARYPR
ncbi:wall-associated receptor kinase 3-like [Phragmites australis]|uniref:wall-associated receptor kinase 3-like n=1 Tax=Phragmites australis TaxID=29695 RepID=UPI002D794836|nr:wall-associated receptor kinase 3-like [Phragmites australis]